MSITQRIELSQKVWNWLTQSANFDYFPRISSKNKTTQRNAWTSWYGSATFSTGSSQSKPSKGFCRFHNTILSNASLTSWIHPWKSDLRTLSFSGKWLLSLTLSRLFCSEKARSIFYFRISQKHLKSQISQGFQGSAANWKNEGSTFSEGCLMQTSNPSWMVEFQIWTSKSPQ